MSTFYDVDFIRLDMSQLGDSLRAQSHEWITLCGRLLHDTARAHMAALHTQLDMYSNELITDPADLEDLKAVLQVSHLHTHTHR